MSHSAWRPLVIFCLAALLAASGAHAQQPSKELQDLRETSQRLLSGRRLRPGAALCRAGPAARPPRVRPGPRADRPPVLLAGPDRGESRQPRRGAEVLHRDRARAREGLRRARPQRGRGAGGAGGRPHQAGAARRSRADLPARAEAQAGADRVHSRLPGERPCQSRRRGAGARQLAGRPRLLSPGAGPAGWAGHLADHRQGDRRRRDQALSRHLRRALPRRLADQGPGRHRSRRAAGGDLPGRAAGVDDVGRLGAGQDDGAHRRRRHRPRPPHPPGAGPVRAHPAPPRRRPAAARPTGARCKGRARPTAPRSTSSAPPVPPAPGTPPPSDSGTWRGSSRTPCSAVRRGRRRPAARRAKPTARRWPRSWASCRRPSGPAPAPSWPSTAAWRRPRRRCPATPQFTARRTALRNDIDRSETEVREARAQIVRAFPAYVALSDPKPLRLAEAQALLRADEALVAILVGSAKSFVWALTRERAEWAEIDAGAQALSDQVTALRMGLDPLAQQDAEGAAGSQAGVVRRFDLERAHALYRLVLAPVAGVFAGKRHLIVVPTGPLTSLPLQVLVTAPPPPSSAPPEQALRDAAWLIKSYALSVLPSVPSLSALRKLPGGAAAHPAVLRHGRSRARGARSGGPAARRQAALGLGAGALLSQRPRRHPRRARADTAARYGRRAQDHRQGRWAPRRTTSTCARRPPRPRSSRRRSASIASSSSPPTGSSPATSPGSPSRRWC